VEAVQQWLLLLGIGHHKLILIAIRCGSHTFCRENQQKTKKHVKVVALVGHLRSGGDCLDCKMQIRISKQKKRNDRSSSQSQLIRLSKAAAAADYGCSLFGVV